MYAQCYIKDIILRRITSIYLTTKKYKYSSVVPLSEVNDMATQKPKMSVKKCTDKRGIWLEFYEGGKPIGNILVTKELHHIVVNVASATICVITDSKPERDETMKYYRFRGD